MRVHEYVCWEEEFQESQGAGPSWTSVTFLRTVVCSVHQTPTLVFQTVGEILLPELSVQLERTCSAGLETFLLRCSPRIVPTPCLQSPAGSHSSQDASSLPALCIASVTAFLCITPGTSGGSVVPAPRTGPNIVPCQHCTSLRALLNLCSLWSNTNDIVPRCARGVALLLPLIHLDQN